MQTIEQQEMGLAAILAIVTNPDMVAKNIQKLQEDMAKARLALESVQKVKDAADDRHAQAKQIEDQNRVLSDALDKREIDLKKMEDHWMARNDEQLAAEKSFNEEKLKHADNVRQLDIERTNLTAKNVELDLREKRIVELETTAKNHESNAAELKKEYEQKLEHIKSFASSVGT